MINASPDRGASTLDKLISRYASLHSLSPFSKVMIALGLSAAFIGIRMTMGPVLGSTIGFSILIPAVLLAGLGGGLSTAILTIVLSTAAMWMIFGGTLTSATFLTGFILPATAYWIIGMTCGIVGASLRRAVHRLNITREGLLAISDEHRKVANEMSAIIDQASAGILRTDLKGRVLQANKRYCEIVGRPLDKVLGHRITEFTHPTDVDATLDNITRFNRPGLPPDSGHVEKRYLRPDGTISYVLISVRILRDEQGAPYQFLSVVVDVTATYQAEQDLRQVQHAFRSVTDAIPVMIWLNDANGQLQFINLPGQTFTGLDEEENKALHWTHFLHPEDRDRALLVFDEGMRSNTTFVLTARYRRHDGQWCWLRTVQHPYLDTDGRRIGTVGTAFDISEIQEATARLEESEGRFRTVANSVPAMIWMVDTKGHTKFGNKYCRTVFGGRLPPRLSSTWRALTHPDDRQRLDDAMADAVKTRSQLSVLLRLNTPDGERWMHTEAAPRLDGNDSLIGFTGVTLDVTDSQRAERELQRLNDELEERVASALAEKAKAEADLVRAHRLEAVGRLTGGVAHDFNNLLTVIMGGLDIILRSDNPDKKRKMAEAALAAAKRGEHLTSQLLAFSRRQNLKPVQTDLNALIREGEPLLQRAVGDAVVLSFKLKSGEAPTLVDASKFEAALINLLVNARDACTSDGKVKLETAEYVLPQAADTTAGEAVTSTSRPRIIAPAELLPGRYVRVSVTDNGEGMSEETQRRVFEPFFTTKGVGHGTGLGLSQVYGFTRQSGGGISVQSKAGKGTKIHLFLPWIEADEMPPPSLDITLPETPVLPTLQAGTPGSRLLLVEDNDEVANVVASMIAAEGFTVQRVASGTAALKALGQQDFDIVLSDVLMPGAIGGIDLARRIHDESPDIRVVLSSGFPGEGQALKDSPWSFLPKPYTGAQLRAVLRTPPDGAGTE